MIEKYGKKYGNVLYTVFRIVFGALFFFHGLQKFGMLAGQVAATGSLMWFAGVIEVVVGIALITGFFTRLASLLGAVEMAVAYIMVHLPQGLNPLSNGGELALLYFAAFLVIVASGAGSCCLEKALLKKETF